jgi:hypothetical protein
MKSIKKFSAMSAKDQPITESAKVTKEAVDELIKKIGFNSIDELKKEKDLLSKLEAMSKTFAKSNNISEDEIEEDRTEDIKDEVNTKGSPKSLEGTKDKGSNEEAAEAIADVEEEVEEVEDDLVSDDQEITKEVPAEEDEVEDEDSVEVASEEKETPKATKRIMAFEDFIKETTVNKNISYHDDDEEKEDYAVPFADSADPLAEPDEDTEMDESVVMGFDSFVNEAYDKVNEELDMGSMSLKSLESMLKIHDWYYDKSDSNRTYDKGNRSEQMIKTAMRVLALAGMFLEAMKLYKKYAPDGYTITLEESVTNEKFTFADAVDTAGEDVKKNEKGIASALKALNARTSSDISIMTDTTEDDGLFDAIEGMKELSIDSSIYDNAYLGKYKGKDVVVFGDGEDLFAYVKESVTNEKFTFADAVDTAGEDVKKNEKGIASALKALNARTSSDISIMTDTTEDDGLFDAIEGMKELSIDSSIYDNAYLGKYKGKDVVVFGDGEDLFAYVKESVVNEARPGTKTFYNGRDVLPPYYSNSELHDKSKEMFKKSWEKLNDKQKDEVLASFPKNESVVNEGDKNGMLYYEVAKEVLKDQKIKLHTAHIESMLDKMESDGHLKYDAMYTKSAKKDIEAAIDKVGKKELKSYVYESVVAEAEITSDDQFKEYATALLKKAFGADYDEAKAMEVVDSLTAKYDGDYGAMVGALQSSIG